LEVIFFRAASGSEPVRDWIKSLSTEKKLIIGEDIKFVQLSWPVGKPTVGSLGNGLWEVRSRFDDSIARVIFHFDDKKIILLHGFIKKTQKTPKQELDLARKRKSIYELENKS